LNRNIHPIAKPAVKKKQNRGNGRFVVKRLSLENQATHTMELKNEDIERLWRRRREETGYEHRRD